LEIVSALLSALDRLDEVIAIARGKHKPEEAHRRLAALLNISLEAASAVLDLSLRRLGTLEKTKLSTEHKELARKIADLDTVLGSETKLRNLVVAELDEMAQRFGDARRTKLGADTGFEAAAQERVSRDTAFFETTGAELSLGLDGSLALASTSRRALRARTTLPALAVLSDGRAVLLDTTLLSTEPVPAASVMDLDDAKLVTVVSASETLLLITTAGRVKRVEPAQLTAALARRGGEGMAVITLAAGDRVAAGVMAPDGYEVVCVSTTGRALRFPASEIRPQQAAGAGMAGMSLPSGVQVIGGGAAAADAQEASLTVATEQLAHSVALAEIPLRHRGGSGAQIPKLRRTAVLDAVVGEPAKRSRSGKLQL
jgi:DNA gyrase subunit A